MRRAWFVAKTLFFGLAPIVAILGIPIGGTGAIVGGLMAADSSGKFPILAGVAIGGAIGFTAVVAFISLIKGPLYLYLFVTHFSRTDSVEVRPRRTIRLNLPPSKAMVVCQEAALQIPGASLYAVGSSIDRVAAGTPLTWQTFGETMYFDVRCLPDPDRCEVIVSSRPAFPTVLVDYGINEGHVETAIAYLRKSGVIDETAGIALCPSRSDGSSI